MASENVSKRTPVPMPFVKSILNKREKAGDLHYEQKLALEYVRKFVKLTKKDSKAMTKELMELDIPRFKKRHAVKIVDLLPETEDEVKSIFSKDTLSLQKEDIKKVLDVVAKYK